MRCFVFPMEIVCHGSTILVESSRKFSFEPISPPATAHPSVCMLLLLLLNTPPQKTNARPLFRRLSKTTKPCMQFKKLFPKMHHRQNVREFWLIFASANVMLLLKEIIWLSEEWKHSYFLSIYSSHLGRSWKKVWEVDRQNSFSPLLQTLIAFL